MRVSVLGELDVRIAGRGVDLGGPKPRALVGLLVAGDGRPVPVEHLIDQIWGDAPPARVEVSLQSYVARIRKALQAAGPGGSSRLRTHPGGYSLDLEGADLDVRRFVDLLREARSSSDEERRLGHLEQAVSLWRGEAYPGLDCPALEAEATRLAELRTAATEELWDLRLRRGGHADAVAELEGLTRSQPLNERWWALLARALYAANRQGDALAALRRAREHLAEELGVDPGPELRRVEQAVLRQDRSLEGRPPETERPTPPAPVSGAARPDLPSLVGREAALATVAEVLEATALGHGATVLVTGEPGIGKSALLEAARHAALARGFRAGRGAWEDEGSPPLWAWSRAVSGLLGDPGVLETGAGDASTASFRQAEALLQAVCTGPPSLLVLDDAHWADRDSLRLLGRVAALVTDSPLALLVAVRSAEAEPAAADALTVLARTGVVRVDLTGLDGDQVRSWVTDSTGVAVGARTAERLVVRTGGNPFFVTELVRLLVAEGALTDDAAEAWEVVPAGVRDVVRERLSRLGAAVTDVARTAAVSGRGFDHTVVAEAAGQDLVQVEDAVESLEGLGLVEETSPGRSRFSHALVRDAVYDGLGATRRARAHAAVAAALERRHVGRLAEHAAELAEHYRLAGPAHVTSASLYAQQAAQQAASRAAYDEALRLWTSAEELLGRDPGVADEDRERCLLGRARALIGLGRALDSWAPASQAATSALERGDPGAAAEALLTVTEDMVWGWRLHPHYDDAAIALWRRVRDALGDAAGDPAVVARLTAGLAFECFFKPSLAAEGTRLAEDAVRQVRVSTSDPRQRLEVMQLAFSALLRPEHVDRNLALADELVELAARTGDPVRASTSLSGRASLLGELGRLEDARSDVVRAADLAERHALTQNLMVTGWARAQLLQLEARWAEAEELLDELDAFEATLSISGQSIGLGQRVLVRERTGRLPELRSVLERAAPYHPFFREAYPLSMIRAGESDQARRWLGPWSEQPPLPRDYLWTTTTVVRSWVWTELGDEQAVADLRADLAPYADRLVYGSATVAFLGSVSHWLGVLAAAAGDVDDARAHLARALAEHRRHRLAYWAELTEQALSLLGG